MTVANVMTTDVTALGPRHHLKRAAREFELGGIRHLPIVNGDRVVVGMISQRDLIAAGEDLARPIGSIMQRDVKTVRPSTPAHEAAYLLLRYAIGSVVVTDRAGVLVGIVTDTDFVRVAYTCLGGRVPPDQIESEEREADRA